MKCISKGFIVKTGMQDSVITEKNILFMTNSDFIIRLYETYNSRQSIFFLMEPALGGELYSMYQRKGFYGSEKHAKFYSAGVVCAFEHLHERHIIYRDLKPENLLLNEKGHLKVGDRKRRIETVSTFSRPFVFNRGGARKVTDMGLAKFVIGKTYTTCGTPDYFAPEVIASTGHTHAVDWWMLGVLIFEFMTGSAPFEAPYPMQIYAKVPWKHQSSLFVLTVFIYTAKPAFSCFSVQPFATLIGPAQIIYSMTIYITIYIYAHAEFTTLQPR